MRNDALAPPEFFYENIEESFFFKNPSKLGILKSCYIYFEHCIVTFVLRIKIVVSCQMFRKILFYTKY